MSGLCSEQSKQKLAANQDTDQNVHLPFIQAMYAVTPILKNVFYASIDQPSTPFFIFFQNFPAFAFTTSHPARFAPCRARIA